MKYNALPTWLVVKAASPLLPKDHPLKRTPTLQRWHDHRTDLCKAFDILFAANALAVPFILYILLN